MHWYVTRARRLFDEFFRPRSAEIGTVLANRIEDGHDPLNEVEVRFRSLACVIEFFGGNVDIEGEYKPPLEWQSHDAYLRSAVYSNDMHWTVEAAALNAGVEGILLWLCGRLADGTCVML